MTSERGSATPISLLLNIIGKQIKLTEIHLFEDDLQRG